MFRALEKFADITPVAASGKATAVLPPFGIYHAIHLVCTDGGAAVSVANILDNITNVKLTFNGSTVFEANAATIQKLYEAQYFKLADVAPIAGVLTIPLSTDHLTNYIAGQAMGWSMAGITTFQLELTFSANVAGSGHTDKIEVYVNRTFPKAGEAVSPMHRRLYTISRNFTGSGDQEITDIPFNSNELTAGLHLLYDGSAAVINSLDLVLNNDEVKKYIPLIQRAELEMRGRKYMVTAAANSLFQIPFDLSGDLSGYLDHRALEDVRLRVNWSAAPGSFRIIREVYVGAPGK
jgi:hypothetical protein